MDTMLSEAVFCARLTYTSLPSTVYGSSARRLRQGDAPPAHRRRIERSWFALFPPQTYSAVSAFQTIPVRGWWFREKSSLIYSRLDAFLALTIGEGLLGLIFGVGYYFCLWVFPIGIHERDSMNVSVQCLLHVLLAVQSLRAVALAVVMCCRDYHNTMAPMLCLYFVMAGTSGAFMKIQQMVCDPTRCCICIPLRGRELLWASANLHPSRLCRWGNGTAGWVRPSP